MDVTIRPWRLSDAPALVDAVRSSLPELTPWMAWCSEDYGEEPAVAFLRTTTAARSEGRAYEFVVLDAAETCCGACGLNAIDDVNRTANLGYWVRTSRTGRGVATAAVRLLRDWAFAKTSLNRLEIVAAVGNVASQRVAEKAGAHREGVLRKRLLLDGTPHDAVVYSFTSPDR
jgi:RimJ/RimL family protein N-acetyltransferase